MKIISGGQTGVDRAALDVALKHGIECGGWCPAGRLDEVGPIPERYPVTELPGGGFDERTAANVRDSDATIAFYFGQLRGGTMLALKCVLEARKPTSRSTRQTPRRKRPQNVSTFWSVSMTLRH